MKILEFIRYYSLSALYAQSRQDGSVPLHHLWNWDSLLKSEYEMKEITPQKESSFRFLKQIFMDTIVQQREVMKSKDADLIYAPFMGDAYFIALMKTLHLYNRPLIAIAQDTWRSEYTTSVLNRAKMSFLRYIVKHGVDKLLFISQGVYDECKDYFNDAERQMSLQHWGVDIDFYDRFIKTHCPLLSNDSVFVTGGSNRDFAVLQAAAAMNVDNKIFIQTNRCPAEVCQTANLKIDRTPTAWTDLLSGYCRASAVAVPLIRDTGFMSGITVVMEGMACHKPIISSESKYYPFDLEKERIGLYVPYGDAKGWCDAMSYLRNNKDEAHEMGERGRYLVEHKHCYRMFCEELESHIKGMCVMSV